MVVGRVERAPAVCTHDPGKSVLHLEQVSSSCKSAECGVKSPHCLTHSLLEQTSVGLPPGVVGPGRDRLAHGPWETGAGLWTTTLWGPVPSSGRTPTSGLAPSHSLPLPGPGYTRLCSPPDVRLGVSPQGLWEVRCHCLGTGQTWPQAGPGRAVQKAHASPAATCLKCVCSAQAKQGP